MVLALAASKLHKRNSLGIQDFVPVLRGVDGNLHFPVPSMNRLNQTEPATFSILLCWAFFRDSVFLYLVDVCLGV
jgi:hypothetical protein